MPCLLLLLLLCKKQILGGSGENEVCVQGLIGREGEWAA